MRKILIIFVITLLIPLFTACSNKINFSDEVFLKYTCAPAGECMVLYFFDRNVEVSSNGTVTIYCDDFDEKYSDIYPTKVIQLPEEDIAKLKEAIVENRIMSLSSNQSTESCDGSYSYITVYTQDKEHRIGGLNVSNKRFIAVEDLLWSMIGDDFNELVDQVTEIQEKGYNDSGN